jgi:hypothetical protein
MKDTLKCVIDYLEYLNEYVPVRIYTLSKEREDLDFSENEVQEIRAFIKSVERRFPDF